MELITNRFNKKEYRCENCDSDFYVNEDDFEVDSLGEIYWQCPLCANKNHINKYEHLLIYPNKLIDLRINLTDNQVNALIKKCVDGMQEYNQDFVCVSTQEGYAFGVRSGNAITVYVTDRTNIYVIKEGEV